LRRAPAARGGRSLGESRLVEAFAKPGCPVCRCLRDDSLRRLGTLLYEHVTDPATRAALRSSRGFCGWHAALAGEIPDGAFGSAIIAADVLGSEIARLERAGRRRVKRREGRLGRLLRRGRASAAPGRARRATCLVCEAVREAEARHLDALLELTRDPRLERAFERSDGVCLPHLERLLDTAGDAAARDRFLTQAIGRWRALVDALGGFVAKHDHDSRAPFTEAEARSWRLALEVLGGAPGLFGSHVGVRSGALVDHSA
jgi:hypothetical protein